ncbi:MAG: plasmid pRiA4b ORF-3 family protein [Ornithinimicrobium sp.]|uniref:plasmid pRiA4b ORF-3 family protein n=1 Tax=Ornithinimicrobium sp. TaxID=1977084 RepID=UPI0026E0C90A|nr:plasmid pRiA4b ORF-3 family protein [Ornithinimicrobium sp.]MDO5740878.1 plasmid pRiA4b ORF-3 family protein [Ornithinimicrobium sp.]
MTDGPLSEMRKKVAELSPEELRAVLTDILGGGLLDAAPEPPTPLLPTVHEPPAETRALTVRVDVDETRPPVWRRLVLRGDLTLEEVHAVVQAAFGWQDYHLHRFWPGPARQIWRGPYFLTQYDLDEGEEGILESEVRLDQVLRGDGDRLFYTYDFGDDWTHTIKLESSDALDPSAPRAVCTGGRRAGPVEDCGGPPGHNQLVDAFLSGPGLSGMEEELREWLPPGWDPTELDLDEVGLRLSTIGLSAEALLAVLGATESGGLDFPEALDALLALAPSEVVVELARLCQRARTEHGAELTPGDRAAISRPYRLMVELAEEEGIPLTGAGWMKPAYVERIYRELGLDEDWIGKGNREDQTQPVARLRAMCQQLGLLRKHQARLVRTPLARTLRTDEEYVAAVAARLLRDRDPYRQSAMALFALLTAASGGPQANHAGEVARIMTDCGLRTSPTGVDRRHALEMVRSVWLTLRDASGRTSRQRDESGLPGDHRAVAIARASLWAET